MSSPTSVSAVFPVSNRKLAPEKPHQTQMPHLIWLLKNLTIAAHPDKVIGFHAFSGGSPESPHLYPRRASLIPKIPPRSAAGNHCASRKGSPQGFGPPKNGAFRRSSPENPHLRVPFCPVMPHHSPFPARKRAKTREQQASRRHSPPFLRFLHPVFRPSRGFQPIGSRRSSPLEMTCLAHGSRSRSLTVPNPLTPFPEPHHRSIPGLLTNCPVKLHLAARKALPGIALPWR